MTEKNTQNTTHENIMSLERDITNASPDTAECDEELTQEEIDVLFGFAPLPSEERDSE